MKFLLDEHIPGAVADTLRRHGVDVLTVQGAGRTGLSDTQQLAWANEQGRVVVTLDADFLGLDAQGHPHAGIAYGPARRRTIGELIQSLRLIEGAMTAEEMANHIEFI